MTSVATSLPEVLPEDAASWLTFHGWQALPSRSTVAMLWQRGDSEILLPLTTEAVDYDYRWSEMLNRLARVTELRPDTLATEMLSEGADVCELKANTEDTIALQDGYRLVQGARNAVVAAANATIHRRGYFGHSISKVAREHASVVRMAHTKRGSYVIPIVSRIPGATTTPEDLQERFDLQVDIAPFERRVMSQLAEALKAVENLLTEADSPSTKQLNESVARGVSYEMCAAIAEVLAAESVDDLDIRFGWARRLPQADPIERVRIPKASAPVIRRMADALRGSEIVAEQTLYGHVRGHRAEPDEDFGDLTIRAPIGTRQRLVHMTLTREQLSAAFNAAKELRPVYVTGRLAREPGRPWRFESVSDFGPAEFIPEQS